MIITRPDAKLVRDAPAYRRMMPFLMRTRNESAVYFDLEIDLTKTHRFIADFNEEHHDLRITIFHVVLWASVRAIAARPRLNRFVCGGRIWQRNGIWMSYSAKKAMSDKAPLVVLKRQFDPDQAFEAMVRDNAEVLSDGRSDRKSHVDKELNAILLLPPVGVRALMVLARAADAVGMLPRAFIDNDPMYASMFIANLGSLKMDAAYHHLYEYGNIAVFCVIGRTKDVPVVVDGKLTTQPTVTLRFSYDERVEDGLYAQRALQLLREWVEDPAAALA
jgi:hypothetical protein